MLFFITENVNFLVADGKTFAHPLAHLDKTLDDLPVIAIDSFRHMYTFSEFSDIYKPGKLKKFVADLHSGKLHREFHYGPDQSSSEEEKSETTVQTTEKAEEHIEEDDTPPDSTFIKLAPSEKRYTLLRNEL